MPYLGQSPSKGDENNFKILDNISPEPAEISAVCTAVWTDAVKAAWKANLMISRSS